MLAAYPGGLHYIPQEVYECFKRMFGTLHAFFSDQRKLLDSLGLEMDRKSLKGLTPRKFAKESRR